MESRQSQNPLSYLEQQLIKIEPKARYLSEMHVEEYVDQIYMEILSGDTQLGDQQLPNSQKPINDFEELLRRRRLQQAERQRYHLQQKLSYLSNSIQVLHQDDLYGRNSRQTKSVKVLRNQERPSGEKQWRENIKRRSQQIQRKKIEVEEQRRKKEKESQQINQHLQQETKQAKKKELEQHIRAIQVRKQQRKENNKKGNQRHRELKQRKSLHQKISENYEAREESYLQERKKKLVEIRNLHKPFEEGEIVEHEQRFFEFKKQREEMRSRERKMNRSRLDSGRSLYRSVFHRQNLESARDESENAAAAQREKIRRFSEHVKECFAPEVSQKKRQEIEEMLQNEERRKQKKEEKYREILEKAKAKGFEYLELMKKLPKKKRNPAQQEAPQTDRNRYKNYITYQQRQYANAWDKILSGEGDRQEKAIQLQVQSQKKQERLQQRWQQMRLIKHGNAESIDEEYFQMINAKLDLLNESK